MNISEIITKLEDIQRKHGDLPVHYYDHRSIGSRKTATAEIMFVDPYNDDNNEPTLEDPATFVCIV